MTSARHTATTMRLEGPAAQPLVDEYSLLQELIPLRGAEVLELGCGDGKNARALLRKCDVARIVAAEVDAAAHAKNLQSEQEPGLAFTAYGAQSIEEGDGSFDAVLMFKSLHHVPLQQLEQALKEVRRVLRPGGLLYVSEPVFAGAFNEVLRLFHDEEAVRRAAFDAMCKAVTAGWFELQNETHFKTAIRFQSFDQFDAAVINVTHTDHVLSAKQLEVVKAQFETNRSDAGYVFEVPHRVDVLARAN